MLKFQVTNGQGLWRTDKNIVSADTTDLKAQFELTADFTGTITVWWRRSDVNNTYTSTLAADGTCTIPAEALAATDKAVYGPYDHDVFVSISDTGRTTTNEYKLTVLRSAFSTNATPGTGGNPTAYEELVEQFDELKADNQTFKDNMTEQQETFENTVTENVDNIRYVVETETAPPIIEEASGAEITLDDSAYRQVRGLNLYGYSRQTQTTGAQLLDYSTLSGAQNGITPSIDDDNYIVLNGTATANAFIYVLCNIPSGTSMFISVNNPVLNNNISVYIRDEESTYSSEYIALDTANKTHAFASASVAISRFAIRVVQGTTLTNFRLRPMLNAGTSALPWEPYSGGYASPSPDWPQPIHSVADEVNLLESLTMDINAPSAEFPETSDTLYVMLCPESGTSQVNIHLRYNDGSYGQDVSVVGSAGSNGIEYPIFITPSKPCTGVSIYNVTSAAARTLSYGMVAISDTALPWRPYGHNVTVESAGANLFDVSKMRNVSTFEAEQNGEYTIFKATTSGTGMVFYAQVPIDGAKDGSKYTISRNNISMVGSYFYLRNQNANGSALNPPDPISTVKEKLSGATLFMVTNPFGVGGTAVQNGQVAMAKDIIVNRGSTPLPWQPYVAPSSALIALTDSLRGIPVSSGGNYTDESGQQWIADYIYRRQTDGKWMIWRNCGALERNGSESWGAYSTGQTGKRRFVVKGAKAAASSSAMCTRFKGVTAAQTYNAVEGISVDTAGTILIYCDESNTTVEAWKTWLQSHSISIVYQLATPTVEKLPENVQTELNGLYTYNLHTGMWNNDGAYMNLKYVADTKAWINNKIAGLSTAMLNQN